jgi:hypothetical protein
MTPLVTRIELRASRGGNAPYDEGHDEIRRERASARTKDQCDRQRSHYRLQAVIDVKGWKIPDELPRHFISTHKNGAITIDLHVGRARCIIGGGERTDELE